MTYIGWYRLAIAVIISTPFGYVAGALSHDLFIGGMVSGGVAAFISWLDHMLWELRFSKR